jgi:D-alanine-D-alanine ligase-like ATP-grasp enzyme
LQPGERVFDKRVPPRERFLAYERYWGLPEAERPLPAGDPYYWYAPAPDALRASLEDLARRAMRAVGGTGYARIDIRVDERTGVINVLEVNAQCGLSSDDSSTVGSMLRQSGQSIIDLIARVLLHGMTRQQV